MNSVEYHVPDKVGTPVHVSSALLQHIAAQGLYRAATAEEHMVYAKSCEYGCILTSPFTSVILIKLNKGKLQLPVSQQKLDQMQKTRRNASYIFRFLGSLHILIFLLLCHALSLLSN